MSGLTPSQTVGPYFKIGLDWPQAHRLITADTVGEAVVVSGRVLDGDGQGVPDALVEIWQADAAGVYHSAAHEAGFRGLGRCASDGTGRYRFETVKPGQVRGRTSARQAPHINLAVFARGLLTHLYTRIYFADEGALNDADEVLACVPPTRRATLLAQRDGDHYVFDIKLQGDDETVFFAL